MGDSRGCLRVLEGSYRGLGGPGGDWGESGGRGWVLRGIWGESGGSWLGCGGPGRVVGGIWGSLSGFWGRYGGIGGPKGDLGSLGGVELWGELRGVQGGIGGCLRAVLQGYEGSMGRVSGGGESMGPMGPRPFFNRPRPLSTGPAPGLSPAPCGRSGRERSWGRTQGVCGERWIGGSPCQVGGTGTWYGVWERGGHWGHRGGTGLWGRWVRWGEWGLWVPWGYWGC